MSKPEAERRVFLKGTRNVGIIGDTHLPYELPGYAEFCLSVFDRFHVDDVIHIGDLIDAHTLSTHPKSPEAFSPAEEFERAQEKLELWYRLFPNVKMCIGNHDSRIISAAARSNLPRKMVKTLSEAFSMPKGWEVSDGFVIDGVLYEHGTGNSGQNAHIARARANMMSTVIGHTHSYGTVTYWTNAEGRRTFGMQVGCGVDEKQVAFSYAKSFPRKCTIGCGVVIGGEEAHFIPMNK